MRSKAKGSSKAWDVLFIVLGVLGANIFYILGGIFGLVAIAQEAEENQPKAEVEPEPAENPAPEKEENK